MGRHKRLQGGFSGTSSPVEHPAIILEPTPDSENENEQKSFKVLHVPPNMQTLKLPDHLSPSKEVNLDNIPYVEDEFTDRSGKSSNSISSPVTITNIPLQPDVSQLPKHQPPMRIQLVPNQQYVRSRMQGQVVMGSSIMLLALSISYAVLLGAFLIGLKHPLSITVIEWTATHISLRILSCCIAFAAGFTGILSGIDRFSRVDQLRLTYLYLIELVALVLLEVFLNTMDVLLGLSKPNPHVSQMDRIYITIGTVAAILIGIGSCAACAVGRINRIRREDEDISLLQDMQSV